MAKDVKIDYRTIIKNSDLQKFESDIASSRLILAAMKNKHDINHFSYRVPSCSFEITTMNHSGEYQLLFGFWHFSRKLFTSSVSWISPYLNKHYREYSGNAWESTGLFSGCQSSSPSQTCKLPSIQLGPS